MKIESIVVPATECPHFLTKKYVMVFGDTWCRWCRPRRKRT